MADALSRDELVDVIARLLTVLGDLAQEPFRDSSEVPEQRQRLLEHFRGVTSPVGAIAKLRAGEPPLGVEVPVGEAGDLVAALWVDVSPTGKAGRVQTGILAREGDEMRGMCVRFESPEGLWYEQDGNGDGGGEHDYHHVQVSGEIRGSRDTLPSGLPAWFPTSRLAPPVPARDPIDLILCALVAVRHPKFVQRVGVQAGDEAVVERIQRILSGS